MTKKTYISPQIEEINLHFSQLLVIGTGDNNVPGGNNDDEIGGEDVGAKEWGNNYFSEDESL